MGGSSLAQGISPGYKNVNDQSPERSEWVAGTEALLSSNALIQCIANILSPIPNRIDYLRLTIDKFKVSGFAGETFALPA